VTDRFTPRDPSTDPAEEPACQASRYASLNDTFDGRALCGCPNCVEYVADRESEDEV
jgi:hypothetical protein